MGSDIGAAAPESLPGAVAPFPARPGATESRMAYRLYRIYQNPGALNGGEGETTCESLPER